MKKLYEKILILCLSMVLLYSFTAYALSARIAFSDPSTSVGSEVDVVMKVLSQDGVKLGDDVVEVEYDAAFLEFVTGTNTSKLSDGKLKVAGKVGDSDVEYSYTLTFKALKAGETELKVSSWGIYDSNNNMATLDKQGSSKVTISEAAAQPESETAGESEESTSETQTAETSQPEGSDTGIVVDGVNYELALDFDASILPETFEKSEYSYKGKTVSAGKQAEGSAILMYLLASDGSGDLFFYDETKDAWSKYINFTVASKSITIYPLPADIVPPSGFTETSLDLNGNMVTGWIWATDDKKNYAILYGMNAEGEKYFYRYDFKERTIQRYFEDPSIRGNTADYSDTVAYYKALQKSYDTRGKKLYAITGALVLIFLGFVFFAYRLYVLGKKAEEAAKNTYRNIRSRRQQEDAVKSNSSSLNIDDNTANGVRKYKINSYKRDSEIAKEIEKGTQVSEINENIINEDKVEKPDTVSENVTDIKATHESDIIQHEKTDSHSSGKTPENDRNGSKKRNGKKSKRRNSNRRNEFDESDKSTIDDDVPDVTDLNIEIVSKSESLKENDLKEDSEIENYIDGIENLDDELDEKKIESDKEILNKDISNEEISDEKISKEESNSSPDDEKRKVYRLRKNLIPDTKEEKILRGVPSLANNYNLSLYGDNEDIFEDTSDDDADVSISSIESALEKSMEVDSPVYPIEEENFEAAKANEEKVNKEIHITREL